MWSICKKELRQFFSSLTGLISIVVFLILNGAILFIFPDNILDYGYASLDKFFQLAPFILLFLIPAITMRSFSDEFKGGTYEILQTKPLSRWQIIGGKYFASLIVVIIALIPTVIYAVTVQQLSAVGGLDTGATIGSYIGLILLAAVFVAISIFCSSLTSNPVVAFVAGAFLCFLVYNGFEAISKIPAFESGADYFISMLGIDFHYRSISRGVIDTRDLVYFLTVILFFLLFTNKNLLTR
jgi:ABC-2 type transport system permease protein